MKKMISLFALVLSLNVFADLSSVSCRIDYTDGSVFLTVKDLSDNQTYENFLGKENFLEPYMYRNLCKQLTKEFKPEANFSWDDYGCDNNGTGERYFIKGLNLELSEEGVSALGTGQKQLHFYSVDPKSNNMKSKYDEKCNWY